MAVQQNPLNTLRKSTVKNMTPYKKKLLAWFCVMVLALSMGILLVYVSVWFVLPFFGIVFSGHLFLKKISCPQCGEPLTYAGENPLVSGQVLSSIFSKNCLRCGSYLDGQSSLDGTVK
jgi:hypothetical protein